jgi:beta-lactamase class A
MLADMKELLVDQNRLSARSQKQLQDWLVANTTGAKQLRAGLPSNWRIGDKTGSGKNGATNDIAICWPPNRAPILVAAYFVGSTASYEDRWAALAEVGQIIVAKFA